MDRCRNDNARNDIMIVDIILIIGGSILNIISYLLGGLGLLLPSQISNAITAVISYVWYFDGLFPVSALMSAFLSVLLVWIAMYGVKLVLWVLKFIPSVNNIALPQHSLQRKK